MAESANGKASASDPKKHLHKSMISTMMVLSEGAGEAGRLLQAGRWQEGMSLVIQLTDGLMALQDAEAAFRASHPEAAPPSLPGLRTCLEQMRDALERRDFVALADLLRYDMVQKLEAWRHLVEFQG